MQPLYFLGGFPHFYILRDVSDRTARAKGVICNRLTLVWGIVDDFAFYHVPYIREDGSIGCLIYWLPFACRLEYNLYNAFIDTKDVIGFVCTLLADTPILPDGLFKILTLIYTFCLALVVCLVQTDEQQAVAVLQFYCLWVHHSKIVRDYILSRANLQDD